MSESVVFRMNIRFGFRPPHKTYAPVWLEMLALTGFKCAGYRVKFPALIPAILLTESNLILNALSNDLSV